MTKRTDDLFPSHPNRPFQYPPNRVPEHSIPQEAVGQHVKDLNLFVKGNDFIAQADLLTQPTQNLVLNGYGEAGHSALSRTPEGERLEQVGPGVAREGSWCRVVPLTAGVHLGVNFTGGFASLQPHPGGALKCDPGQEFYAELWVKSNAPLNQNQGNLYLLWEDADTGQYSTELTGKLVGIDTTWRKVTVQGPCPENCSGVQLYFEIAGHASGSDNGKLVYLDAVSMRRMVSHDLLSANTVRTDNYLEEDGTMGSGFPVGSPLAGVKLDNVGTALKVASSNLQVGPYNMRPAMFGLINGIHADPTFNRLTFKGNNDLATRDGRPNIDRFFLRPSTYWNNVGGHTSLFDLRMSRTDLADNGDGLHYATVKVYWKNASANILTHARTLYVPLNGVVYNGGTLGASGNDALASFWYHDELSRSAVSSTTVTPLYMLISVTNVYGPSDERWFIPPASVGTWVPPSTTPGFSGAPPTSPGTGGGSGGVGGHYCPRFYEPVKVADGRQKVFAGELRVGDLIETYDENTFAPTVAPVSAISLLEDQEVFTIRFEGARRLTATADHRVYVTGSRSDPHRVPGWTAIKDLLPGDTIWCESPAWVVDVVPSGRSTVARITVDGPATYVINGVLNHNIKNVP